MTGGGAPEMPFGGLVENFFLWWTIPLPKFSERSFNGNRKTFAQSEIDEKFQQPTNTKPGSRN
jgi:hypothetical protein